MTSLDMTPQGPMDYRYENYFNFYHLNTHRPPDNPNRSGGD